MYTYLLSTSDLDYVFSDYCGILFTSTFYFIIYCAVSKNKPKVYPRLILPGLISGIMWGIAMSKLEFHFVYVQNDINIQILFVFSAAWFLANQHLSLAVSFPIVTAVSDHSTSLFSTLY